MKQEIFHYLRYDTNSNKHRCQLFQLVSHMNGEKIFRLLIFNPIIPQVYPKMYSRIFFIPTILFVYVIYGVKARIDLLLNEDATTLYIFNDDYSSWDDTGNSWIQSIGSKVIISNSTIQSYVKSIITGKTWIGGIKEYRESEFKWFDGRSINYTNWADGEPDGAPVNFLIGLMPNDYCIAIDTNGRWHDAPCFYGYHTIRQVDVTPSFVEEFGRNITSSGFSLTPNAMGILAGLHIDYYLSEQERHLSEESENEIKSEIKTMEEHKNVTLSDWNQVIASHSNISETMEALKVEVKDIVTLLSDIESRTIREELRMRVMSIKQDDLISYKDELEPKLNQYDSDLERHEHRMNNISTQLEEVESVIKYDQHSYHIVHSIVFVIVFISLCLIVFAIGVLHNRNLLFSTDKSNTMFKYRSYSGHTNLVEDTIME